MPRSKELTTAAELTTWMHDEYLSELTIADLAPLPCAQPPNTARFTWWLATPGARVPYRCEARGVTRWTLDGELDSRTISIDPVEQHARGFTIAMDVPGRLTLTCTSLVVTRGRSVKTKPKARPFTDYAYFTINGVGSVDPTRLCAALTDASDARITSPSELCVGPLELRIAQRVVCKIFSAPDREGGWLSVTRGSATDDEWHRCQALPRHLAGTEVCSAWEFIGTPAAWLACVRAPG